MFSRFPLSLCTLAAAGAFLAPSPRAAGQMLNQTAAAREVGPGKPVETPTPEPEHKYTPAKVLKREPVGYPELAHLNRIEGVVRVKFSIDETGHVTSVSAYRGNGGVMLDAVALDPRLKKWLFQPATLDGKPIPSAMDQEFEFKSDLAEQRALAEKRLALSTGTPQPPYPPEAVAKKLAGRVTIGIQWQKDNGLVDTILLVKSSDSPLLDETALRWVYENWRIDTWDVSDKQDVRTIEFKAPK